MPKVYDRICDYCGKHYIGRGSRFCSHPCTYPSKHNPQLIATRFWEKVDKTSNPNGCWEWIAGKDSKGYGVFSVNGKSVSSHRFAWMLKYGSIPTNKCILHRCDNPVCVRDDHLFVGTQLDNIKDCVSKKRTSMGIRNGSAKLTESDVIQIRILLENGYTQRSIAKMFGVAKYPIHSIAKNKTWKHIN